MAMSMDQMMMMMARMHAQNYSYNMQLAQHFNEIGNTFNTMAQGEYQMYMQHLGQAQGQGMMQQMPIGSMAQQMPSTMMQQMTPGMSSMMPTQG